MKAVVSVYHDTRHEKKDNTYPVKIRVYDGRITKFYSTGVNLTEDQFSIITTGKNQKGQKQKVTGDLLTQKNTVDEKRLKATDIADKIHSFTHKEFEKKFERDNNAGTDIFHFYNVKIKELQDLEQIKTSIVYLMASDSFKRFLQPKPTKLQPARTTEELRADKSIQLQFVDVDIKWLNKYQKWMLDHGNSLTTISMYLRTLRTIFNIAISEKEIQPELYPFGKDAFSIPTGAARKHSFQKEDLQKILRTIWKFKTNDELIIKARDFWFWIYNAYGMNVADIVRLRDTNVIRDTIFFVRKKTKTKNKKETVIEVPITGHMQHVIDTYGQTGKGYVFEVLEDGMDEAEKVAKTDAFTNFINDHMERLCKQAGVPINCTTYTARHFMGTMAIRNGAPTALVQKAFGHQSILTTENYIGDFDSEAKRNVSDQLMKF
jgi:integrase/recombinase XerD